MTRGRIPSPVRRQAAFMVQTRIKSHREQAAAGERRAAQTRLFRRNQIFGLLLFAAIILVSWLVRTNPKWIFPPGWWRP